jgi:Abnormal spindle-like microcephaly-assoc'd, ASPM-SPD-2-Hydin
MPQSVTLSNIGFTDIDISSITTTGDFSETNTCRASLAVGTSCTVSVTFTPTALGTRTGTITVSDSATGSPQTVPLTGTGAQSSASPSPDKLTFGIQKVGTTSESQAVTLTNSSCVPLDISNITTGPDFAITINTCGTTLDAGASCDMYVAFAPTTNGTITETLNFYDDAPNSPQVVTLTGTGEYPTAIPSPTSLNFGSVSVGFVSAPQTVTLSNTSSVTLNISSIATSGDFSISSNNCGASLPGGGSCMVSVTFTPTAEGNLSGKLTFADDAKNSLQNVGLSGTGLEGIGQLKPTSLNFGNQNVGTTSAPKAATLTNIGNATLGIASISITGANSGDFAQSSNCGSALAPLASCTINVTFTPTATGSRSATLTISLAVGSLTASLTGTGTAPAVTFSPTSLTFGNQQVGIKSQGQKVTLTNSGTGTLTIASVSITGADSGDFSQTNTCPGSLAAGNACSITVTFTPTEGGTRTASVSVTDNAAGSPQQVPLTGTGTAIKLSPTSLTFPTVVLFKTSTAKTITVTNLATIAVTVTGISITGANSGDFAQTNTCGGSVAGGGSCTISVTFTLTMSGTRTASVSVSDNGGGSPQTATLTGTGTEVQLSPSSLNFGSVNVGQSSSAKTITLTNVGSTSLSITSISITGSDSGDFSETNTCGGGLGPGGACSISVTFTPTTTGTRSASVSVGDNGGGSPQTVSLSGTGI